MNGSIDNICQDWLLMFNFEIAEYHSITKEISVSVRFLLFYSCTCLSYVIYFRVLQNMTCRHSKRHKFYPFSSKMTYSYISSRFSLKWHNIKDSNNNLISVRLVALWAIRSYSNFTRTAKRPWVAQKLYT